MGGVESSVRERVDLSPSSLCRESGTGAKAHHRHCQVSEGGRVGAGHDLVAM